MFTDEAREAFAHAEGLDEPSKLGGIGSRLPLSNQEKAIAELHETINQLASRLKPILTPVHEVDETSVGVGEKEIAAVSPLAEQLEANNRGIHRASSNINGLLKRLEC